MILAHDLIKYREAPLNLKPREEPSDFNKLAMLANVDLNDKELKLWIKMFKALIEEIRVQRDDFDDFRHLFGRKCEPDKHKPMCYDSDCMWDYKALTKVGGIKGQ